jgi:HPt (histidine-containing phosphotransfer) domain-containing protein
MDSIGQPALTEAVNRLWGRFLPQLQERIATLETSAAAFTAGHLSTVQQAAANAAAHKLAGVLGTFGLTRGTVLARELEIIYSRDGGPDPAQAARLTKIAAELRNLVENRI